MLDAPRVADARDAVHDVARILGERVVHGRGVVGAAAVVVDAEAAADVDVAQAGAHQLELGVDVRELVDGVLHAADVLQLAARVAVHELQAVLHARLAQHAVQLEDLGHEQAELRLLARRLAPAPAPSLASLTRTPMRGRTSVGAGVLEDQAELV
jgi:hypothetical protein